MSRPDRPDPDRVIARLDHLCDIYRAAHPREIPEAAVPEYLAGVDDQQVLDIVNRVMRTHGDPRHRRCDKANA